MIQIARRCQTISPGGDFALSGLSSTDKSKIYAITGQSLQSGLAVWRANQPFPALNALRSNRAYLIQSNLPSGSSFESYSLPIPPSGNPAQDDNITRPFQFFTYRGDQDFSLSSLSSDVKSRIARIYTDGITATSNFAIWTPLAPFPSFRFFVPGKTYLIESQGANFSPYVLGVPSSTSESSSTSGSSSTSDPQKSLLVFLNDSFIPDAGLVPTEYVEA